MTASLRSLVYPFHSFRIAPLVLHAGARFQSLTVRMYHKLGWTIHGTWYSLFMNQLEREFWPRVLRKISRMVFLHMEEIIVIISTLAFGGLLFMT